LKTQKNLPMAGFLMGMIQATRAGMSHRADDYTVVRTTPI
jgi:hypothetical protein